MQSLEMLDLPPFDRNGSDVSPILLDGIMGLCRHHFEMCPPYKKILNTVFPNWQSASSSSEIPWLPVSMFKTHSLKSIADDEIFKTLTSSGTTSQQVSKVYLDRTTAMLQTKALAAIMTHFVGPTRRPMLIIDTKSVIKDRKQFSARGAGIIGMMNFGRDHFYALNDDMSLDLEGTAAWLQKNQDKRPLLFGFTFMVWQYFLRALEQAGHDGLTTSGATLVHSGGWKKLQDQAVSAAVFNATARNTIGCDDVRNFYGMVEQVGSIFVGCDKGYFHTPTFADVLVRDPLTLDPVPHGDKGVLQVQSLLPQSYPGHSLLTEDVGVVHGKGDCECGLGGTYFEVNGRLPKAEIRGCSDTHSSNLNPAQIHNRA